MQANRVQQQPSTSFVSSAAMQGAASAASAGGPQLQSRSGEAPQAFFDAARNGDIGALATMLAMRQASAAALEPKSGMTALMLAAIRGHVGVVSLLTERRDAPSFINARDARGNTALFLARAAGHDELAALLEEAGAQEGAVLTAPVAFSAGDAGTTAVAANDGPRPSSQASTTNAGSAAPSSTSAAVGVVSTTAVALPAPLQKPRPTTLLQAAEQGDAATLREMLEDMKEAGKDLKREVNRFGESTKLMYRRDRHSINHFRHADEADTENGWEALLSTPLSLAAAFGHEECVDVLLKTGADADALDEFGPCIAWAVKGGYVGIVSKLVAAGVSPNSVSPNDLTWHSHTPLTLAAAHGRADVVRTLLEAGAKVDLTMQDRRLDSQDEAAGLTPLMLAARGGHAEVVQVLIAAKANVHAKLPAQNAGCRHVEGMTALIIAAQHGRAEVCRLLIKAGGNVNEVLQKSWGFCALEQALCCGRDSETVQVLLDAGARLDFLEKGPGRMSALVTYADQVPVGVIHALIKAGQKADRVHEYGHTALGSIARYGQSAANAAVLVQQGADMEYVDDSGCTPLMQAASGAAPMVQALLEAGAKVDRTNQKYYQYGSSGMQNYAYGYTALMYAAARGQTFILRMLLRAGADPNVTAAFGKTPLMIAVDGNHINAVRLLLDAGADCKRKDQFDETAHSVASKKSFHEIAVLLQKHM